jgi:uncharacterized protein YbjT (DUF2867 family)
MILLTGATGNVGRELVPLLLDQGRRVRLFVRDAAKVGQWRNVDIRVGNLDQPNTLEPALAGVEALFLVSLDTHHDEAIVRLAQHCGVGKVVLLSTIEAGADPPIGPGKWHRQRELLLEQSGLRWTFLRPTMMMVNAAAWWAESIRARGAVFFPGGDGRCSPIAPADIAAVACTALLETSHDGNAYELTGPELLSIPNMVQVLAKVLNKPITHTDVPEAAAAEWMIKAGLPRYVVDGLLETMTALRANRFAYTTDTVERVTGRAPQTFESWCRKYAHLFAP